MALTIAGWLLNVEPERMKVVRAALGALEGLDCRSARHASLVVVSECEAREGALEAVRQALSLPGVRDVSLVAVYRETEAGEAATGAAAPAWPGP